MDNYWKKVSETYLTQTPWLSLRKDGYKTDEVSASDYYIVERPDYVVIVPQTKDKKFLLVRQYRHGVQKNILNFPMGFIDQREKTEQAATRELVEEIGVSEKNIKIKFISSFFLAPGFLPTEGHVFFAQDVIVERKTKALDCNEHIRGVEKVSARQLEELIKKRILTDLSSIGAYLLVKNYYAKDFGNK